MQAGGMVAALAHRAGAWPGPRAAQLRVPVIGLVVCLAVVACGSSTKTASPLQMRSCTVQGLSARCGTLQVPEDRLSGTGRMISIRFVVFPARGHSRAPDPVVDFSGGPGGSAVGDIPAVLPELGSLNQDRDLVFIDQRGAGSSHGLSCPSPPGTLADQAQVRRSIESCLVSLRGKADLRFYTSAMAAQDVVQVLSALGYGKVNLFGGSYGASAAQVFQQMFPARVRTMTLLGGTLLGIPLFERFPQASQQALDQVFAHCASDPACHDAFPRLDAEWTALRASLARNPVNVPAALSTAGTAIRLDDVLLASGVHQMLLSADTAVYIPLVIHSLYAANGLPAATTAVLRHLFAGGLLPSSDSQAVISYPILCAEPWARYQPAQITDTSSYYYQVSVREARWWQYVCTLIPAPGAAASYGRQRPSSVPVLMINGTADPQDPPANMSGAQQIWPNGHLMAEPGQSHRISLGAWLQCDADLVQAFVEHASAAGLNTCYLAQVALPPFPAQW
jgi:pimeloyl-ACP methyl ester carboxylesterase